MQTEEDDKVKNIFSSGLKNYQPNVPGFLWDRIEENLPPVAEDKKAIRLIYFKRFMAVAGVAASIVFCVILLQIKDRKTQQVLSGTPVEILKPVIKWSDKKKLAQNPDDELLTTPSGNTSLLSYTIPQTRAANAILPDNIYITEEAVSETIPEDTSNEQKNREQEILQAKILEFEKQGQSFALFDESEYPLSRKKDKGFSLSIGGKTGIGTKENQDTYVDNPVYKIMSMAAYVSNSDVMETNANAGNVEEPVDLDHRLPLSFGLTVNKSLTNNLSIETGLIYTYLSSKVKSKEASVVKRYDSQYFHYLGIPVSLNYTFLELGKADIYVSGGMMLQKDIAGRQKGIVFLLEDKGEGRIDKNIHQENLQFSVMSHLGASYPVYDKLHAYANVGGAYYFDAKNKYKTIFSDKKIQLDIDLGLKWKF